MIPTLTPRTDKALWRFNESKGDVVSADFARELEREIVAVRDLWQIAADNAIARQNLLEKAREDQQRANQTRDMLRLELFQAEAAMDVKNKALSRLYCAEYASIGEDFSAAIQMEIEDAMKQADTALRNPLRIPPNPSRHQLALERIRNLPVSERTFSAVQQIASDALQTQP